MVTVAHIVERIVRERPFLQEALSRGIVNHAALANEILPEIERELRKPVTFSAVNMAVRRLSERLERSFVQRVRFDASTDITIRSDIVEICVFKSDDVQARIKNLYDLVDFKKGDFLTVTQGINEMLVLTNRVHEAKVRKLLPLRVIKKVIKGLSSVTIRIPLESIETVGLFYLLSRALAWENINIIEIVSTMTEMTLIIREEDTSRAFTCLKRLIEGNSERI